jgi:hypothetical protein
MSFRIVSRVVLFLLLASSGWAQAWLTTPQLYYYYGDTITLTVTPAAERPALRL